MRWAHKLRMRLRSLFERARVENDLNRELRFHFDQQVEENLRQGMSPDAARLAARREFGNVASIQEQCRDFRGLNLFDELRWDLRYASRTLVRTPGFFVAVASLALAIGATTAVYTTVDWLLNRSSGGVYDPDRLVTIQITERDSTMGPFGLSIPQYHVIRDVQTMFVDVAAYGKLAGVISSDAGADQVVFEFVTGNYFELLGVRPALGRLMLPADDAAGKSPAAMISYDFWQTRFGGDARILDKPVRLNGQMSRVVGVLPREFQGYRLDWNGPTSVWLPLHSVAILGAKSLVTNPVSFFRIIGRLRPGMTLETTRDRAQSWIPHLPPLANIAWKANTVVVSPISEMRIGRRQEARTFLGVLLLVCGLILLAACFNVANFVIGRAVVRRRELALRAALGASRPRLARQLLTEALLLGLSAVAIGVAAGIGFANLLSTLPKIYLFMASNTTPLTTPAAQGSMVTIALVLGIAATLVFALLPAFVGTFRSPLRDLKNPSPHWTWSGMRVTPRQIVLVFQVALSVALAVTAGLYLRSVAQAARVSSDYDEPESVLVARVVGRFEADRMFLFYTELLSRLNSLPEVQSAAIGWNPPYMGGSNVYGIPGKDESKIRGGSTAASSRFFETHGVPIVAGREFAGLQSELKTAVIVNRVLADKLWPGRSAIGQTLQYGNTQRIVIGIVGDDRCNDLLGDPHPCAWQPFGAGGSSGYLRIRTHGDPMLFVPQLKQVLRDMNPDVAIAEQTTLADHIADLTGTYRTSAVASTGLAVFGVALLGIGCVSLFVSMVRDSRREIAIRMALGATSTRLTRRIVSQGILLIAIGVAIGLAVARVLAFRIADQLYKTEPTDLPTFMTVPAFVVLVGIAAVAYSAMVATRIEPARLLQTE